MTKPLTQSDRDYAEDMGLSICENCGSMFHAQHGYTNLGHLCGADGARPEFEIPWEEA